MKNILVLSDSHRNIEPMFKAIALEKPDMIIHLGDHYQDAMKLLARYPSIPIEAVNGNCDFDQSHTEKLIIVEDKKLFLCHGHNYGVKSSYLNLEYAAREKGADIVLFGHTHQVYYEQHNHLTILNPGSIGNPRYPGKPSYAQLIVENGQVFVNTHILQD